MSAIVGIVILILLALLFAWLVTRAWRAGNAILKWLSTIVASLLTLILALVAIVAIVGFVKLSASQGNPLPSLQANTAAEQMARGERLARYCQGCHSTGDNLPLDGGTTNFAQIPGGPALGTIVAPNLTPAGPLKDWSDGAIIRAIREGVDNSGKPLVVMPSQTFHGMSDADAQALVGYMRSQPAVAHDTPPTEINLLGTVLIGAGVFSTSAQPPITQPVVAPPPGTTPDYGQYLVGLAGCRDCHGSDLTGGKPGGFTPVGPNLRAIVPQWSEADFVKAIRTGTDPKGLAINPNQMPWKEISAASTDDDLKAIYAYIHGLALK